MDEEKLIEVEDHEDAKIVNVIVGQLHMYHIPDFREQMARLISSRPARIILVLEQVQYLDSSAMGSLFQLQKDISAYGGALYLVGINHTISMVFKLTKSDKHFIIYETLQEALEAK